MAGGRLPPPRGLTCTACGSALEPCGESVTPTDEHRMVCPKCGEVYRARLRNTVTAEDPPTPGAISLYWRRAALRWVEWAYYGGTITGVVGALTLGGFVPVLRGWLQDEVNGWGDILALFGGVDVVTETRDPDADLGPVLARTDAPQLFSAVNDVSRRLGLKPPGQVRLTYLPCCGVVAWGRSRALVLGLPLLRVLTLAELRAVLAHELAHLARGDATRAARSVRFVEGLRQALDRADGGGRGPLGLWARTCRRIADGLIGPVARGQEVRADRLSAAIAGGSAAASALVKVAMVQPLFREVLDYYDPTKPDAPNLYAFFRAFWYRLPAESHSAMRLQILASNGAVDPAHPSLSDRLSRLQAYPDPVAVSPADAAPATSLIGDLETFELMLHNRLFALPPVEPSIFHKAGT